MYVCIYIYIYNMYTCVCLCLYTYMFADSHFDAESHAEAIAGLCLRVETEKEKRRASEDDCGSLSRRRNERPLPTLKQTSAIIFASSVFVASTWMLFLVFFLRRERTSLQVS